MPGAPASGARFEADNDAEAAVADYCRLIDALVQGLLDHALAKVFRLANPTEGERLAVVAVGGYGRAELAPYSDIDLLFLHPYKRTPHTEQMIEFLLYKLWDLGLKVGQATRSIAECVRGARADLTTCTNLLEARFLWGDAALFEEFRSSFETEVVAGRGTTFVEAKLAERDARHQRTGDSRYLLEPNVKEGKGGLRDLQTLFWLGRFLYRIERPADLVEHGVLDALALRKFTKARRFLWAVRCHLHYLSDRAEERLTFDLQPEIARRLGYRDHKGSSSVERFMKHYYLTAKEVGALTRIFCAALEEQHRRRPRLGLARFGFGRRRIDGMVIQGGRIAPAEADLFEREPLAMLRLFQLAQERELDIHPQALRAVTQNLRRIGPDVREDPAANALFMAMLTSRKDPATTLRRMNEAGLLGRFLPEFGRVVAQMEHSLYHVYTVDEHTIQAIDGLHQIENGLVDRRAAALHQPDAESSVAHRAVRRHAVPRPRQGPQRRSFRDRRAPGRADRATARPQRRAGGDRGVAGAPPSPAQPDRVQARRRRSQDGERRRRGDPVARAPAPAADHDRRRHPRGRAERLERLEGPAPAHPVSRDRRGARGHRFRPPPGAHRGRAGGARRGALPAGRTRRCAPSSSGRIRATG